jgi:hypothetical protein
MIPLHDIIALIALGCFSGSSSNQQEEQASVAGEAEGAGSQFIGVGAGSSGSGDQGSIVAGSGVAAGATAIRGNVGQQSGHDNTDITTIDSSDPAVTEAALETNAYVSTSALNDEEGTAVAALQIVGATAQSSIAAGVASVQENDLFGEYALQSAADAEANSTTALEAMSTESETIANNAVTAAQNETLAGVTPAQELQDVSPETPGTLSSSESKADKWAAWITIAVGVLTLIYFLRKGKLS